jgi:hypothetical protein
MNYITFWTSEAEAGLADAWLHATDRSAVNVASHLIDQALAGHPLRFVTPRIYSVIRMAYEPPLGVEFEIIEDDKKVRVLRVWSLL